MQTIQQDINALAKQCGVDPSTVEQAANAVVRRLIDWHGDKPIDASQDIIEAALHDHARTVKKMAVSAHIHNQAFSREVLDLLRAGGTEAA